MQHNRAEIRRIESVILGVGGVDVIWLGIGKRWALIELLKYDTLVG